MKVARGIATPIIPLMGGRFSPLALFAASEPGGWYDPSDLTTLFQDAAGTTPVTAVEQPVGLVLDKSKGLATSAELLTNPGPFSATTGWTGSANCVLSTASSRLIATYGSTDTFYQAVTVEAGKWYFAFATLKRDSGSGTAYMNFRDGTTLASSIVGNWNSTGTTSSSDVVLKATYYASANGTVYLHFPCSTASSTVVSVSAISTKTIAGNHLSQSTSTARPVLSARVNLLTRTEEFSHSDWVKPAATVTANVVTAPDGTLTADKLIPTNASSNAHEAYQSFSCVSGVSYTFLMSAANAGYRYFGLHTYNGVDHSASIIDLNTGTVTQTGTGHTVSPPIAQPNGFYRFSVTFTGGATTTNAYVYAAPLNVSTAAFPYTWTGNGTDGAYVWGADLRPANAGVGLPAYQRVGAATDYDTTGFPLFLRFDGTDDFLQSSTITPGSVDKAQVFAGVRKLSDAAVAQLVELSDNVSSNAGTFSMPASDGGAFWTAAANGGNGGINLAVVNAGSLAAPISTVNTSLIDFALATGDVTFRVNGTSRGTSTTNTGSSNFGSYPLYVGRRGGATLPFNGQLYSLILRFSATNMDAATIASTETWVNQKTRAY